MKIRRRVRVRFRKEGDLRLTSHRDVVRVFERLFRRAGLKLSMTEGFHPKARMNFPLPLSLGIAGCDEVMEFDLAETIPDDELADRMRRHTPPGLTIDRLEQMEAIRANKARVDRVAYETHVPEDDRQSAQRKMDDINTQETFTVRRSDGKKAVDLLKFLEHWEFIDGKIQFRLKVDGQTGVHPREVLQALGLADIERRGHFLRRTEVHINETPKQRDIGTKP